MSEDSIKKTKQQTTPATERKVIQRQDTAATSPSEPLVFLGSWLQHADCSERHNGYGVIRCTRLG